MEKHIFVARERELAQLDGFLRQALAAQGLVCFVTGEAGSGKTALITEFARRAQEKVTDLAVAVGQSDAQTGAGDADLPFREVLGQLTGDVETKLAQGAITKENASRLQKLLILSSQALVEVGPDLIGIFVPGAGLAARVGAFAAKEAGWLGKLENLIGKQQQRAGPGTSGIEQRHIFEQYTNVVCRLSDKHPLLLVLDDLQWADVASIGLLFHLARRIGEHRILIVGTYRPEEVAIGRGGERHPLEKVLAELKRYHGDILVDLDRVEEIDGRGFVDAFLDSEPNRLPEKFRHALYQHTNGHALFTIELLRTMQERGDLVQDAQGYWVEAPGLAWESLPERVEGVIEERIGRLEQELRQLLTIGSVEGKDFTAEVVARVQAVDAGSLVRRLSAELDRQHRLVKPRGVRWLEPSRQRLSLYRFQHNLFQRYLYYELDEAERAYLHEDVGNALEQLYGAAVEEIVVQLARHFEAAGVVQKARLYLGLAGRQAAARFANDEAIAYFRRALDLTPESEPGECYLLLLDREQIYGLQGERQLQAGDLARLQALVQSLGDDRKGIELALHQASYALATSDYPATIAAAQQAIHMAEATQDIKCQAIGHLEWGRAAQKQGDHATSQHQLEQSLALSRAMGLQQVEADSLRTLGLLAVDQRDFDRGRACYEDSLRITRESGDRRGGSKTLIDIGNIFAEQGDYSTARGYYEQALPVFRETGDRRIEGILLSNLAVISACQGDLSASRAYLEQARRTSHEVGDRESERTVLGNLGVICGWLGDYSAAGEYCEQSLRIARELSDLRGEASALSKQGIISVCLGDYVGAQERYQAALEILHHLGYEQDEAVVLANLSLLCHLVGEDQAARDNSQLAQEIAQQIGDTEAEASAANNLGHALAGLGNLTEAVEAYQHSLALRRKLDQPQKATEPLAGLARICLIQENPGEALTLVEEILEVLETHTLAGTDEPVRVYLTCYRVLTANQDTRAKGILNTAYRLLQERAARIDDEGMRCSYLENVLAHRELMQEYSKTS